MNLSINSEILRNVLLEANLIEEDEKIAQQDVNQKLLDLKNFIEEAKVQTVLFFCWLAYTRRGSRVRWRD